MANIQNATVPAVTIGAAVVALFVAVRTDIPVPEQVITKAWEHPVEANMPPVNVLVDIIGMEVSVMHIVVRIPTFRAAISAVWVFGHTTIMT